MGEIILKGAVKREHGYLYYVDKEGNVCRSRMRNVKEEEPKEEPKEEPEEPAKFTIP